MAEEPRAGRLVVVGLDHRSAPAELRERLFIEEPAVPTALQELRSAGFSEVLTLSTCDRVVAIGIASETEAARNGLQRLARHAGLNENDVLAMARSFEGEAAIAQLFAIASALESQILGEPQVLGQLKAAHRLARELGGLGGELEAVLQAAYACAKRVRSETAIAEHPVSMAACAVQLARDLHGELGRASGLLIGTGDMGQLLVDQLQRAGLGQLVVVARQPHRAEALARAFGCNFASLSELDRLLIGADVIVACQGEGRLALTLPMVAQALRQRRRRPMFFADMAVPRDVEPAINDLDGAFLYGIDDLERVALAGRTQRTLAAEAARAIVAEEARRFSESRAERRAVPAVVALRRRFERLRAEILGETGDVERATELLINRLLHDPSEALRRLAAEDPGLQSDAEGLVRMLFRLEDEA
ncbi:MAG: glutamyl-tRNA reductase [Proteobacteria bacterium]|nr:glutamyl-tRNA reductase [Pseudomonadota bacterium]MBI3496502.1 glutamyl-tRNA reductase [Pseudomonadota bacterium]